MWRACASPRAHWPQIYSTDPLERLNAEIKQAQDQRRGHPMKLDGETSASSASSVEPAAFATLA
ncbi:transposase [Comamonas thiooxydans]|uniref:transposase n=1 Tax=Comamonas thiooxydans TaxID=363952 RepID=UPI003C7B5584